MKCGDKDGEEDDEDEDMKMNADGWQDGIGGQCVKGGWEGFVAL